jgi:hypothetical protein
MTGAQVERAEQRMQQQWHDLVMAEQAGAPLEVLEQMYDLYILLAEEYNACSAAYQQQKERRHTAGSASRTKNITRPTLHRRKNKQNTKLAS